MDSVIPFPSSGKMGNATPYANKKWVACSDNKTVLIITKITKQHYMYNITMNRCGHLYTKKYRTV